MKRPGTYAYEDTELTDRPGERWKPLRGFEDRYEISDHGRIKSLTKERVLHHGGIQRIGPMIRRQRLATADNKKMGDHLYTLIITLKMDGLTAYYSVGRLVYDHFVESFDLSNTQIYISYKDGDGRNLHYTNLFLTNLSEMRNKSFATGRSESHLSILSKPIGQFDISGKLIKQFESMYQAEKETGISVGQISKVAGGRGLLAKGYCWQFGTRKRLKAGHLPKKDESTKVNIALMEKLGKKRVSSPLPAVFDLSLEPRSDERWKDFPGYEGLYRISSHGRVKALRNMTKTTQTKWYPEKIKCITVGVFTDSSTGKAKPGTPSVTLCKEREKRRIYIARWVYHLFVAPFDINDSSLRIYHKDGNKLNMQSGNLELHSAEWSIISVKKSKGRNA